MAAQSPTSKQGTKVPRILVHGTNYEFLKQDFFLQNSEIRDCYQNNYNDFGDDFISVRSWRGRNKYGKTWLIEVDPKLCQLLVDQMRGKVH